MKGVRASPELPSYRVQPFFTLGRGELDQVGKWANHPESEASPGGCVTWHTRPLSENIKLCYPLGTTPCYAHPWNP